MTLLAAFPSSPKAQPSSSKARQVLFQLPEPLEWPGTWSRITMIEKRINVKERAQQQTASDISHTKGGGFVN